jgi:hypothetical protein
MKQSLLKLAALAALILPAPAQTVSKTPAELTALSEAAGGDLLIIWDIDAVGASKLRRISLDDLRTSLTLQPLDADLTAIAGLTTTPFGRSSLSLADAAAGRTLFGLGNVDNTSDLGKPISTATATALAGKEATGTAAGAVIAERSAAATLTNKRMTRRVQTLADAATVTPSSDDFDAGRLTPTQNFTLANPTGTPTPMQVYVLRLTSAASRAITWGTAYRAVGGTTLPTATTGGGNVDYVSITWNADDSKWDVVSSL